MPILKTKAFPLALVFFGLILTLSNARAQSDGRESSGDVAAPIEPLLANIDETQLFSELLTHNELRNAALVGYTEQRTYEVTDMTGAGSSFCTRSRASELGVFF